jgi:hypothetical protein
MQLEILKPISIILTTSPLLEKVEQKTTFSTLKKVEFLVLPFLHLFTIKMPNKKEVSLIFIFIIIHTFTNNFLFLPINYIH